MSIHFKKKSSIVDVLNSEDYILGYNSKNKNYLKFKKNEFYKNMLVTGLAGSGKSTLMYDVILKNLKNNKKNIVVLSYVEDDFLEKIKEQTNKKVLVYTKNNFISSLSQQKCFLNNDNFKIEDIENSIANNFKKYDLILFCVDHFYKNHLNGLKNKNFNYFLSYFSNENISNVSIFFDGLFLDKEEDVVLFFKLLEKKKSNVIIVAQDLYILSQAFSNIEETKNFYNQYIEDMLFFRNNDSYAASLGYFYLDESARYLNTGEFMYIKNEDIFKCFKGKEVELIDAPIFRIFV